MPYRGLGSGIPRVLAEDSDVEFIDNKEGNQFTAIVKRPNPETAELPPIDNDKIVPGNVLENVLNEMGDELSERQKNIMSKLVDTSRVNVLENVLETSASLAAYFGVDARTIRRDLSDLQTRGIIRHDGPDKGGRWIIMIRDHDNS